MSFDPNAIDELIHGRIRLAVMAFLSTANAAEFTDLRNRIGTTDGNLSTHLRKLEEAGYVTVSKGFVARKPQTVVTLTDKGRTAFLQYLDALKGLIPPRAAAQ